MEGSQENLWKKFCKRYDSGELFSKEELKNLIHTRESVDYECYFVGVSDYGDVHQYECYKIFKVGKRYFEIGYGEDDDGDEWFNSQPKEVKPRVVKKIEWVSFKRDMI